MTTTRTTAYAQHAHPTSHDHSPPQGPFEEFSGNSHLSTEVAQTIQQVDACRRKAETFCEDVKRALAEVTTVLEQLRIQPQPELVEVEIMGKRRMAGLSWSPHRISPLEAKLQKARDMLKYVSVEAGADSSYTEELLKDLRALHL